MRKTMMTMGLGVALLVGGADVAAAQRTNAPERQPRAERQDGQAQRGARGERGQRGPGRMQAMLFRGIELTAEQQQRVQALNTEFARGAREGMAARGERPTAGERGVRGARGDSARRGERPAPTAEQRAAFERRRAEMQQRQEQHVAQLRAVLTPAQRTVFDRNVAEMQAQREARATERGQQGARGAARQGTARARTDAGA